MTKKLNVSDASRKSKDTKSMAMTNPLPADPPQMKITSPIHLFHHLRARLAATEPFDRDRGFHRFDEEVVKALEKFGAWSKQDSASASVGLFYSISDPDLAPVGKGDVAIRLAEAWRALLEQSAGPSEGGNIGFVPVLNILISHLGWRDLVKVKRDQGSTSFKSRRKAAALIGAHVDVTVRIGS